MYSRNYFIKLIEEFLQILLVSLVIATITDGFNVNRAEKKAKIIRIPRSDFEKI